MKLVFKLLYWAFMFTFAASLFPLIFVFYTIPRLIFEWIRNKNN